MSTSDKIAKAYLAMKKPKRYPSLFGSFGSHSTEVIQEAIESHHSYVMDDKYYDTVEEDRVHDAHKLHDDLNESVSKYTKRSREVNGMLHGHYNDEPHDRSHVDHAKEVEQSLNKNVAHEHFHVFTGLPHSPFKRTAVVAGNHMVHMPAFTSTTTDFRKSLIFAQRDDTTKHNASVHSGKVEPMAYHVLKIHVHPGVSIASVRHVAHYSKENEMLMNRGYDMKIDPVPTRVHHESQAPLYVWNAYPVARRPRDVSVDTGKKTESPVRLGIKTQS